MQKFKHDFEKLIAFKRKGMWVGTGAAGADKAGAAGADKAGGADLMQVLSKSKAKAKQKQKQSKSKAKAKQKQSKSKASKKHSLL